MRCTTLSERRQLSARASGNANQDGDAIGEADASAQTLFR